MDPELGGVKGALQAEIRSPAFAAVLATVAAEYADHLELPAPDPDAVCLSERAVLPQYPAVEIIGDASEPEGGDDGAQEAQSYRHRIALVWTALADDETVVTAQVERSVLALRRYLRGRVLDVAGAAPLVLGREDFSPVGRRGDTGPFLKSGILEVAVPTYM
jgi:hypothetical protein